MRTLEEAWLWYTRTRDVLALVERLGRKHWEHIPPESHLWKDEKFRNLHGHDLEAWAGSGLAPLEDLAILVLFSVFEAEVRLRVLDQIAEDRTNIKHPTLVHAVGEAIRSVEEGSFFRVMEPFKPSDADLVEEVNQVRRYRNWVAHGRQESRPPAVRIDARTAYDRLTRFLKLLGPSNRDERGGGTGDA